MRITRSFVTTVHGIGGDGRIIDGSAIITPRHEGEPFLRVAILAADQPEYRFTLSLSDLRDIVAAVEALEAPTPEPAP